MGAATESSSSAPPRRLGAYELVKELRAGGMARLYLGRRTGPAGFSRSVAIKTVHGHLAKDATFIQMFLDEARLAAQLSHPNVVHVEELGEQDGVYYMVMELVRGANLAQLLTALKREGTWIPTSMALAIASEVAAGLHAAHTARSEDGAPLNVVHRDVSPHNVMLTWSGQVKLIDFGIAKATGSHTTGKSLKGKLRYMAPEQARGLQVDPRTDVYALGVMLWELVVAERRFQGDNDFEILEQVREPTPVSALARGAAISSALDAVIARATAAAPDDRYESAAAFRQALLEVPEPAAGRDELGKFVSEHLREVQDEESRQIPGSASVSSVVQEVYSERPPPAPIERRRRSALPLVILGVVAVTGGAVAAVFLSSDPPVAEAPAALAPAEREAPAEPEPADEASVELARGVEATLTTDRAYRLGDDPVLLLWVDEGAAELAIGARRARLSSEGPVEVGDYAVHLSWADITTGAARLVIHGRDELPPPEPEPEEAPTMRVLTGGMATMTTATMTTATMTTATMTTATMTTATPMTAATMEEAATPMTTMRVPGLPVTDLDW